MCYFQGHEIKNCKNNGDIYVKVPNELSGIEIGGILWEHDNGGSIISCVNSGNITVVGDGSKISNLFLGGIEAEKYSGLMEKCTNKGNITVENCTLVGDVVIGGITGDTESILLNNLNMGNINIKQCVAEQDIILYIRRHLWERGL